MKKLVLVSALVLSMAVVSIAQDKPVKKDAKVAPAKTEVVTPAPAKDAKAVPAKKAVKKAPVKKEAVKKEVAPAKK